MKKFVSMMLAFVLALSLMPSAFAAETVSAADKFTDVPADAWYLDELNYALHNGYISGTSATTFSPDGSVTRGQFVTILGRMSGIANEVQLAIAANGMDAVEAAPVSKMYEIFTDVKAEDYYCRHVWWAASTGVMNGVGDGRFDPEALITVEQMGTALANCIKMANSNGFELKNFKPSAAYADASSISAWASENMALVQKYGLLVTDEAGNVNPHKVVTRAECTTSVVRLAKALGEGSVPVFVQKSDTAETAAKKIHDALWAEGVLNSNMTQKEKARVYFDWIRANCQYDYSFSLNNIHNAYGALINGKAVCDGYTAGYNMLLATEDIECSSAYTKDHEWTVATLDGVVWHIDATQGYPYLPPELMLRYHDIGQKELDANRNGTNNGEYTWELFKIRDEIEAFYAGEN